MKMNKIQNVLSEVYTYRDDIDIVVKCTLEEYLLSIKMVCLLYHFYFLMLLLQKILLQIISFLFSYVY